MINRVEDLSKTSYNWNRQLSWSQNYGITIIEINNRTEDLIKRTI